MPVLPIGTIVLAQVKKENTKWTHSYVVNETPCPISQLIDKLQSDLVEKMPIEVLDIKYILPTTNDTKE
jgi:hypothetical protein